MREPGYYQGGVWVGGWLGGLYRYYPATARGGSQYQRSGSVALQGAEWWVLGPGRALHPETTLRARSVTCGALPVSGLRFPVKRPCKASNLRKPVN